MHTKTTLPALLVIMSLLLPGCIAGGDVAQSTSGQDSVVQQLIAQGKFSEAETILEKAVKESPQSGQAWFRLGYVRHAQKKYESALKAHLKATDFPQYKAIALYNAACVYSLQEKTDKSIETLQQAVAAGFTNRTTLTNDTDLDNVRSDARFASLLPPLLRGEDVFVEPSRVLKEWDGQAANDEFGWVARRIGDVDGDKVVDFVTSAPGFRSHSGKVYVYSSRTGKLLFSRTGKPGQRYGRGAEGAGDVNGDGVPDVIVGAPAVGTGTVEVLSGKDGSVIHAVNGTESGGQFGYAVAGLGDLDRDGFADFVVTTMNKATGNGRCHGYSGKDGHVLFTLEGEREGDKFGSSVAGNADPNHPMLAVGAQDAGEGQRGRVYVYRFAGTQPKLQFVGEAKPESKELGQGFVSFPGDLDRDGVPDVYCSDFSDQSKGPSTGRVFVFSGASGKVILDVAGKQQGEGFGTSVSDAGDADGDGRGDLIVGAWQNKEAAVSGGKVYLISGADGKTFATWTCKEGGDTLGFDATGIGDVDGDGGVDYLLTSAWSAVNGPKTGRVFIVAGPVLKK